MIIGHQKQWEFFKAIAAQEKVPHALLLYGQEGLGKKTIAFEFVKLLYCKEVPFAKRPCGICRSCRDVQKKVHPDVVVIESKSIAVSGTEKPQSYREDISIANIRDLLWKMSLRPYIAPLKIAVIDTAHVMTREAQNCFLKLLEEPKGATLFLLITEYPEALLKTVLSRVQKIRFLPVPPDTIKSYCASRKLPAAEIEQLAGLSYGRPGIAIDFLSDLQQYKKHQKLIGDLTALSTSDLAFRFRYAKDMSQGTLQDIRVLLDMWLRYLRDVLLAKLQSAEKNSASASFQHYSVAKICRILASMQSTRFLLSTTNSSPKLALELLFMKL